MTETASTPTVGTRGYEGTTVPAAGTWTVDPSHTTVGFLARHMMVTKVRGRFTEYDATVVVAEDPLQSSVTFAIAAASVDTREPNRDGHLRSADFFDVERFPTIDFRSTGLRHVRGEQWQVDGDLTIRGTTRPLTLDVTFEGAGVDPFGNTRTFFSASAEIDREAWGLTWNAALETGGVLVSKKVSIDIEASLIKA